MKKLKLNVELLRVQSFDTSAGPQYAEMMTGGQSPGRCCSEEGYCREGTIEAFGATDDCASKKDTMCEPPPSGQQGCFHFAASDEWGGGCAESKDGWGCR